MTTCHPTPREPTTSGIRPSPRLSISLSCHDLTPFHAPRISIGWHTQPTRPISNNQRVVSYRRRPHTSYPGFTEVTFYLTQGALSHLHLQEPSITLLHSNLSTSSPSTPRRPVAHFTRVRIVQSLSTPSTTATSFPFTMSYR